MKSMPKNKNKRLSMPTPLAKILSRSNPKSAVGTSTSARWSVEVYFCHHCTVLTRASQIQSQKQTCRCSSTYRLCITRRTAIRCLHKRQVQLKCEATADMTSTTCFRTDKTRRSSKRCTSKTSIRLKALASGLCWNTRAVTVTRWGMLTQQTTLTSYTRMHQSSKGIPSETTLR